MTNEPTDHLAWLMRWYAAQCDGDWEHDYGVVIETVDNPGWLVKIDLADTDLATKPFDAVTMNLEALNGDPVETWRHCKVEDGHFSPPAVRTTS